MNSRHSTHLLFGLFLLFAACSGDCSCTGFESKPFTKYSQTVPSSGLLRVTPTGLGFVEQNLPAIVEGVVPGGLNFCIPEAATGNPQVCYRGETCSAGGNGCDMAVSIDDAAITPQAPDTLLVDITLGDLDETISVGIDLGILGTADCFIDLHAMGNSNLPGSVDAQLPLVFSIDPNSPVDAVKITTGELDADLANLDFQATGDLLCFSANLGFVKNLVKDQLIGQIDPLISGLLTDQLCKTCTGDPDCAADGATCNGDGFCDYAPDDCVPAVLGLEGELQIGSVIGDFSENPGANIDMVVRAADVAEVNDGLSLGLRSGYDPEALSNCVPVDPTVRNFAAAPISPTVSGNTKPGGQPFMLGVAYHERALEHMMWSMWGSGATCLRIGTEQVDLLTTGLFGAVLPSIKTLALNEQSELYIKIVPQKEPVVLLGANTVTEAGNTYVIDEPLINLDWKDFDVHIYGYIQSRFTRVATIRMDLLIPIALAPTANGEIIPILGDLGGSIMNERVLATEMIVEDPQRLLDLLPTLIGMALPSLAGSLSDPIALPEFFGFRVDIAPGDITSVDGNTQIALFANLVLATNPIVDTLDTRVLGHRVNYDKKTESGLVKPRVTLRPLAIPTTGLTLSPLAQEVEFSYRVNNGTWSLPVRGDEITIDDPLFVLPGDHTIDVRARYKGEYMSEDMSPASYTVRIDYAAPEVTVEQRIDRIELLATDDLSTTDTIEYRHRLATKQNSGTWSAWSKQNVLPIQPSESTRLDVEVRDEMGNVNKTSTTLRTVQQGLEPAPTNEPKAGCATSGSNANGLGGLALLFLLGLVRIRRRVGVSFGASRFTPLLFLLLMFSSCDCGDNGTNSCECSDNETCVEGVCQPNTCQTDADCVGQVCINFQCVDPESCEATCECPDGEFGGCDEDDMCVCEAYCPDGCGDGEYCCYENNACEPIPDPCADLVCDPGFQTELTGEPAGDSATCGVADATCECVPVPPLDIGIHGQFTSFDQNGGVTAIANYNTTYEDLMVGIVESGEVTWYWVDGVPSDGMVTGAEDGPRGGISTKGDKVGTHTAIGIDDAGVLHVFYRDEDRDVMKYARGTSDGATYSFAISDFDTNGDTGYWPSLIVDGSALHLIYGTKAVDVAGEWRSQLRYTQFTAAGAPDVLAEEVLDFAPAANPCGAACGPGMKCFANLGLCAAATADCAADCGDDTCYQATCEPTYTIPPQGLDDLVGGYTELSQTPNGLLAVYFDKFQDSAKWVRQSAGTWGTPVAIGATTGPFASGVVDTNGDVYLAYQDRANKRLVFDANGTIEVIQDGVRDTATWWIVNDIGEDVQLRQNGAGNFVVVYQDATEHILHRAERMAADAWNVGSLGLPGDPYTGAHGFYLSMLKDAATDTLVETVINSQLETPTGNPVLYE